jgi:hypothetical protein
VPHYRQGIQTFRRRGLERTCDETLPAAFVLDSDMAIAAEVVASFRPVATLQLLGAARRVVSPEVFTTLEHAAGPRGARTLVVCTEDVRPPETSARREAFLADALWLRDQLRLRRPLGQADLEIESMWFDVEEGDLYLWDPGPRRFELLADSGLEAFVARVRARSTKP